MKIFLGTDFSEDRLRFAAQIGVDGVSGAPKQGPGDDGFFSVETLRTHKDLVESYSLEWAAVRMAHLEWTYKWQLGLPGADEQIENYKKIAGCLEFSWPVEQRRGDARHQSRQQGPGV